MKLVNRTESRSTATSLSLSSLPISSPRKIQREHINIQTKQTKTHQRKHMTFPPRFPSFSLSSILFLARKKKGKRQSESGKGEKTRAHLDPAVGKALGLGILSCVNLLPVLRREEKRRKKKKVFKLLKSRRVFFPSFFVTGRPTHIVLLWFSY